jgi:hypothetical protein
MLEATVLDKYVVEVAFNGITSLPSFINVYHLIQKLLVGGHSDRWTDSTVILQASLSFLKERRRKGFKKEDIDFSEIYEVLCTNFSYYKKFLRKLVRLD